MRTRFGAWFWCVRIGVIVGLIGCQFVPAGGQNRLQADGQHADVWWPTIGAHVAGTQPFKALLSGLDVDSYRMTWDVDNGAENPMPTSRNDYPHKEALVDLSGWNWNSDGKYNVDFRAYNLSGALLAEQSSIIYVGGAGPSSSPAVLSAAAAPAPAPSANAPANAAPVVPSQFYASTSNPALSTADAWSASRPADASIMRRIGTTPTAQWFGGWNANVTGDVDGLVSAAAGTGKTPVLVAYNIPDRDCGSYSAGGASRDSYLGWMSAFAAGLKGRPADVILEPDALAQINCLGSGDQAARLSMLSSAVAMIKNDARAKVYLDAGNAGWVDAPTMASRLKLAGVDRADGFSLNVSGFISTQRSSDYGHDLSKLLGGKHFIIDTSRNGVGGAPDGQWCNPSGQALGATPTTATGDSLIDAYLWIKTPGESDGSCNGGPSAGTWWPDYALALAKTAKY